MRIKDHQLFGIIVLATIASSCANLRFDQRKYLDLDRKSPTRSNDHAAMNDLSLYTSSAETTPEVGCTSGIIYTTADTICDTIFFRNGDVVVGLIKHVTRSKISYRKCVGPNETITQSVSLVHRIAFANGDFIKYPEPKKQTDENEEEIAYGNFDDHGVHQHLSEKRAHRQNIKTNYPKGTPVRIMSDTKSAFNSILLTAMVFWMLSAALFVVSMISLAVIDWEVSLFLSLGALVAVWCGALTALISIFFKESKAKKKIRKLNT